MNKKDSAYSDLGRKNGLFKQLSKNTDKNDVDSLEYLQKFRPFADLNKSFESIDISKIKSKESTNFASFNNRYMKSISSAPAEYLKFYDEVVILRKEIETLQYHINSKSTQNMHKEEQLNYLEKISEKNKKKIKKIKSVIKHHDEKFIQMESKLDYLEYLNKTEFEGRRNNVMLTEKKIIPNLNIRSKKKLVSSAQASPRSKNQLISNKILSTKTPR